MTYVRTSPRATSLLEEFMAPTRKDLREVFNSNSDRVTVRKLNSTIELRIGEPKAGQTRYVRLTPHQARSVGSALIAEADKVEPIGRTIVPGS